MKVTLNILISVFLFIGFSTNLYGQTYDELIANTSDGKDISEYLPPLAELQNLAIENSPVFKMLDADVKIGEYKVKEEQREWMRALGIEGGVRYGLFDNLILTEDLGLVESNTETTEQTRYSIGIYAKIPLGSIADKSNVKTAKAEKEKLRYQRESRIQELRQMIIIRYNAVMQEYRAVVIKSNAVEGYRTQIIRAKVDFENGKLNIADYVRLENMLTQAVLELEKSKLDYITAYQILEETVGVKIKLRN
jgi:outer membrane protein TolC